MTDAVNAYNSGLGRDELIEITGSKEITEDVLSIVEDVKRYSFFKQSQDLGIVYGPKDLTFTDMLLFSWIRGTVNGRKN